MGIDYTVYVGPTLECKITYKDVEMQIDERRCSSAPTAHGLYNERDKFCTKCGFSITSIPYTRTVTKSNDEWYDIFDGIGDSLSSIESRKAEGILYFVANDTDYVTHFDPRRDEKFVCDISSVGIEHQLREFRHYYKEQIEWLVNHFGKENVRLFWGVVNEIH